MSRTVLITGGAGFIGRHVAHELVEAGHHVRVLDSLVEQVHGADAARPKALLDEIEFHRADIRNAEALKRALSGVTDVVHLAAEVGVGQSMYEIDRYVSANDLGTAVLLQQLIERPVERVVVASSMSIYGEGLYETATGGKIEAARRDPARLKAGQWDPVDDAGRPLVPLPTPEDKRIDLNSVYALSKYAQEQLVLITAQAYGMTGVALRLFNVFGPGQSLSNPYTGVLAIFASRLANGQRPLVFEDGKQQRDFVHVTDVARAFRLALERDGVAGRAFNIGSGRRYSVEEVGQRLADEMGVGHLAPEITAKARAGDIRHCFADIGAARAGLGYEPRRFLEDSLGELVAWVADQNATDHVAKATRELEARGLVA